MYKGRDTGRREAAQGERQLRPVSQGLHSRDHYAARLPGAHQTCGGICVQVFARTKAVEQSEKSYQRQSSPQS